MTGLLLKDFRLFLQQKRFFAILVFIAIIMGLNSDSTFTMAYLTFVCSFFVLSTISYDEFDNCYPFLMTLPVKRSDYVKSKYLFGIILSALAWLAGFLISLCLTVARNTGFPDFYEYLCATIIYLPLTLIIMDIIVPFQLKFGGDKARIAMFLFFGIVAIAVYASVKFLEKSTINVDNIIKFLNKNQLQSIILILVLSFIATFISCLISSHIMNRKEF